MNFKIFIRGMPYQNIYEVYQFLFFRCIMPLAYVPYIKLRIYRYVCK